MKITTEAKKQQKRLRYVHRLRASFYIFLDLFHTKRREERAPPNSMYRIMKRIKVCRNKFKRDIAQAIQLFRR